jgi:hypothetical protein
MPLATSQRIKTDGMALSLSCDLWMPASGASGERPTTANLVTLLENIDILFASAWVLPLRGLVEEYQRLQAQEKEREDPFQPRLRPLHEWAPEWAMSHDPPEWAMSHDPPDRARRVPWPPVPASVLTLSLHSPLELLALVPAVVAGAKSLGYLIDLFEKIHNVPLRIESERESLLLEIAQARSERGHIETRQLDEQAELLRNRRAAFDVEGVLVDADQADGK